MKILVAGWDSGGGVEAVQTVVRRAVARGHKVRVLGTEGLRSRFESAGADFRRYRYAPDNDSRSAATDLVREWEARTPMGRSEEHTSELQSQFHLVCRLLLEKKKKKKKEEEDV